MAKKKNLLAQLTEKLKGDLTQVDLGVWVDISSSSLLTLSQLIVFF